MESQKILNPKRIKREQRTEETNRKHTVIIDVNLTILIIPFNTDGLSNSI